MGEPGGLVRGRRDDSVCRRREPGDDSDALFARKRVWARGVRRRQRFLRDAICDAARVFSHRRRVGHGSRVRDARGRAGTGGYQERRRADDRARGGDHHGRLDERGQERFRRSAFRVTLGGVLALALGSPCSTKPPAAAADRATTETAKWSATRPPSRSPPPRAEARRCWPCPSSRPRGTTPRSAQKKPPREEGTTWGGDVKNVASFVCSTSGGVDYRTPLVDSRTTRSYVRSRRREEASSRARHASFVPGITLPLP